MSDRPALSEERPVAPGEEQGPAKPERLPALMPGSTVLGGLHHQSGVREQCHGLVAVTVRSGRGEVCCRAGRGRAAQRLRVRLQCLASGRSQTSLMGLPYCLAVS